MSDMFLVNLLKSRKPSKKYPYDLVIDLSDDMKNDFVSYVRKTYHDVLKIDFSLFRSEIRLETKQVRAEPKVIQTGINMKFNPIYDSVSPKPEMVNMNLTEDKVFEYALNDDVVHLLNIYRREIFVSTSNTKKV